MISRKYRFHGHNSLNYLFRRGRTVRSDFISLRFVPSKNQEDFRLAIVVSKKVSKSAVVRNRIRRRIYEIVRVTHKSSEKQWPFDMAITVFDERIAKLPNEDLTNQLHKLLHKARIF